MSTDLEMINHRVIIIRRSSIVRIFIAGCIRVFHTLKYIDDCCSSRGDRVKPMSKAIDCASCENKMRNGFFSGPVFRVALRWVYLSVPFWFSVHSDGTDSPN